MSENFEGYERQYCELSTSLSRKCTSADLLDSEEKKQKFAEIQSGLNDADVLIRKMDLEARSLQPSLKAVLLAKLREYKSDLNNLKGDFKTLTTVKTNREALLESGMANAHSICADQRERLAFSTDRLNESSNRIKESSRTALETEDIGISILEDLHQQRQTLLHSHSKLHEVDSGIEKSKKILKNMSQRMSKNKWIVGSIIGGLVFAIIIVLFYKLFHH